MTTMHVCIILLLVASYLFILFISHYYNFFVSIFVLLLLSHQLSWLLSTWVSGELSYRRVMKKEGELEIPKLGAF